MKKGWTWPLVVVVILGSIIGLYAAQLQLLSAYTRLESVSIKDRHGELLTLLPNNKGQYVRYVDVVPLRIKEILVKKEDRFFYWHPGVNPYSTMRATVRAITGRSVGGASTITQQLVKNLLGNEQNRSIGNKVQEMFYAFALEIFTTKEQIITMYANTVYMGNQVQGLREASQLYFGKDLADLDDTKIAMLLATLSSPSIQNPWEDENARASRNLALRVGIDFKPELAHITARHPYTPVRNFELASMGITCTHACTTTLDATLTDKLRDILRKNIDKAYTTGAHNGAIVVIKLPENQLLAIVGTPDTRGLSDGQQINMAVEPRPIGSTAKPFIYLQGFAKGLRPYTLVDDREYKFPTADGFPLYPKNYDGQYRGWITLHSALSNSLNVPTVKVLQYVGLHPFYNFLTEKLGFKPLRDLDSYQYGIALGGLEMDPLTLAHFLTLFPANGMLRPLQLFLQRDGDLTISSPMSLISHSVKVADAQYTQLVTKILNDRFTGVEQFGLAGNLNLFQHNYAVKTGTSRDYHDSWTVGYTPDFLVVTWLGNAENKPLQHITGQSGAGAIWNETMELLLNSDYNKKTRLDTSLVRDININGSIDFGLKDDVVSDHRNLLKDTSLITSPQDGDTFLLDAHIAIPLTSQSPVDWFINDQYLGHGTRVVFNPTSANTYKIKAVAADGTVEHITIVITDR